MRRRRDVGGVLALLVSLAVAGAAQWWTPASSPTALDVMPGADGWADTGTVACRLLRVERAPKAVIRDRSYSSDGEYLLFQVDLRAHQRTQEWLPAEVRVGNTTFRASRIVWLDMLSPVQPGFVNTERVLVEFPVGAWRGGTLVLRTSDGQDGLTPLKKVCALPVPAEPEGRDEVRPTKVTVRVDG